MATYNANEIIGKTLFAKKKINVLDNHADNSKILYSVNTGNSLGPVYSWIMTNGALWWQLEANNNSAFVKHEIGAFDVKALEDQGAQTTLDKINEEKETNKSSFDKIADLVSKNIKTIAIIGGIALIATTVIKKKL